MAALSALILSEGISALTIAEIASRLRCSRRRIYDLAPTKEDLFLLVSRELFDSVLEEGARAAAVEKDLGVAIAAYLEAGTKATARLSVAYLNDLDASDDGRKLFEKYQVARARGLESLITEGVRRGVFAPHNPRLVSEALLGASQRVRRTRFLTDAGLTLEQAAQELYRLFLEGLLLGRRPSRTVNEMESAPKKNSARRHGPRGAKDAGDEIDRALDAMLRR